MLNRLMRRFLDLLMRQLLNRNHLNRRFLERDFLIWHGCKCHFSKGKR